MLRKEERLRSEQRIYEVRKARQFHYSSPLLQIIAAQGKSDTRIAIICSKYVGKSAKRNRIKRIIKGAYKIIRHNIAKNLDIVVNVKRVNLLRNEYEKEFENFNRIVADSNKNVVNIPKS